MYYYDSPIDERYIAGPMMPVMRAVLTPQQYVHLYETDRALIRKAVPSWQRGQLFIVVDFWRPVTRGQIENVHGRYEFT